MYVISLTKHLPNLYRRITTYKADFLIISMITKGKIPGELVKVKLQKICTIIVEAEPSIKAYSQLLLYKFSFTINVQISLHTIAENLFFEERM